MDIEKRLSNLEKLVDALSKKIDNTKYYTDADIEGNRQSVTEITPYTETKTAYIEDAYCVFENVPQGLVSVYVNGASHYNYDVFDHRISVKGLPLEEVTEVTISIQ